MQILLTTALMMSLLLRAVPTDFFGKLAFMSASSPMNSNRRGANVCLEVAAVASSKGQQVARRSSEILLNNLVLEHGG